MSVAELPDTDDPFELLAVEPSASARELKRAYVARIKVYRPDREPAAFARIRAAYEQVRAFAKAREDGPAEVNPLDADGHASWYAQTPDERGTAEASAATEERAVTPESAPACTDIPAPQPFESVSAAFEAGDVKAAQKELDRLYQATPTDQALYLFVMTCAAKVPDRISFLQEWWRRGLVAHVEMAACAESLDTGVLRTLTQTHALRWKVLRHQERRDFALWLFRRGAEFDCLMGRSDEVAEQLRGSELRTDTLATPELITSVWHVLAVACWDDPSRASELMEAFEPGLHDNSSELQELEDALDCAGHWSSLRSKARPTDALEQMMRYGWLGEPHRSMLYDRAVRDLRTAAHNPWYHWLGTLDVLSYNAPYLCERLLEIADLWKAPDDRVWDELEQSEQDALKSTAYEMNTKLAIASTNGILLGAAVGIGLMVKFFGYSNVVLILVSAVVTAGVFALFVVHNLVYKQTVRPFLLKHFCMQGVSPDRVLEACAEGGSKTTQIVMFEDRIREDRSLYVLAALYREQEQ